MIESQVGRVNENFPRDSDPTVDYSRGAFRLVRKYYVVQTKKSYKKFICRNSTINEEIFHNKILSPFYRPKLLTLSPESTT